MYTGGGRSRFLSLTYTLLKSVVRKNEVYHLIKYVLNV